MGDPSIEPDLAVIATLREPTRRRLYEYVEHQPQAVGREEAAEAVGVSRALAAFHLKKLVAVGLLKAEYRRLSGRSGPGAGRTSKLYRRSRRTFAVTLPHRDHELLARVLAELVDPAAQATAEEGPARGYGRLLGARARKRIRRRPSPARLAQCVKDVLESVGFEPFVSPSGEIRLRNCPFDPLSRVYTPVVCGVGQAVLKGVVDGVGADTLQVRREEVPDRCCGVLGALTVNELR